MSRISKNGKWKRYFSRGPWEMAASITIAAGVFMLMQPLSMTLFSYSFSVILAGTIGFVIVSHFPEGGDG